MTDASSQTAAHRLPADVLLYLGALFRPRPSEMPELAVDYVSLATWANIPAVCRTWRDVCLGSPSYWSYIVLPVNHVHPRRMFARAQDASLDVVIEVVDDMDIADEDRLADGLSLLEDKTRQLRSFSIRNSGTQPIRKAFLNILVEIISGPLPQLRSLCLHDGIPREYATALTRDIALQAPALRDVSMRGYHRLNWTRQTAPIHQLRSLHLTFLSFTDMRGALAYLPHLRSAVVDLGESQLARRVDWAPPPKSLRWPALEELTFTCHPSDVPTFWEALDVPATVQVTFVVRHLSPYVAAIETREMLSTALSLFLPTRTIDKSHSRLTALTLTSRHVDLDGGDSKAALKWYAGGSDSDVHTPSLLGERARTHDLYTTAIIADSSAISVALGYLQTSFGKLESLYLDLDSDVGSRLATVVAKFILPHLTALRVLLLRGQACFDYFLHLSLPNLEQLIIEDTDLTSGFAEIALNILVKKLAGNLQPKSIHLRRCLVSKEIKADLDGHAERITFSSQA